jgi:hypothetical protein
MPSNDISQGGDPHPARISTPRRLSSTLNWLSRVFSVSNLATVMWVTLYFMTLGFGPKYRERLRLFEGLDPKNVDPHYERYTEPPSFLGLPYVLSQDDSDTNGELAGEGANPEKRKVRKQRPRYTRPHMGVPMKAKQGVSSLSIMHMGCEPYSLNVGRVG